MIGHNYLSCFSDFPYENSGESYVFQWLKNNQPIQPNSDPKMEYVEPMRRPIGLMLKLGPISVYLFFSQQEKRIELINLLQVGANYTCVAYDRRAVRKDGWTPFNTSIIVPVNVANTMGETCDISNVQSVIWPVTLKVRKIEGFEPSWEYT